MNLIRAICGKLLHLLELLIVGGLLTSLWIPVRSDAQALRPGNPSKSSIRQDFVYLFDPAGAFLKLRTSDASLAAYWNLNRLEGASAFLPPPCRRGRTVDPACNLIFGHLRIDNETGRLYGVFPTKHSIQLRATELESDLEYEVLVIQLEEMKVVGSLPIPQAQPEPPVLLVTPDGKRLLLHSRDREAERKTSQPTIVSIIDTFDASSLKKLSSKRQSLAIKDIQQGNVELGTEFGEGAYFSPDGSTIFEGSFATAFSSDSMVRHYVSPLKRLPADQREQLKRLEKIDAATQIHYLDSHTGDSAAGRTLVRVINPSSASEAARWTLDLSSGETSPVFIAPFGVDYLTPDGRLVLIQEAKVTKDLRVEASGHFKLFDVASGKQVGAFENEAVSGNPTSHPLLCFSPLGDRIFFGGDDRVRVLSLPDGKKIGEVDTRYIDSRFATCAFSQD